MSEWIFDDPEVPDGDKLYRRIPHNPDCRTFDPLTGTFVLHPGGLRRETGEGMSTHLDSVLQSRSRDCMTLYDGDQYGSIRFEAGVPREVGAGVLATPAPKEPDEDLRVAHAEVRPPKLEKDRVFWNGVANQITTYSEWVQPSAQSPRDLVS